VSLYYSFFAYVPVLPAPSSFSNVFQLWSTTVSRSDGTCHLGTEWGMLPKSLNFFGEKKVEEREKIKFGFESSSKWKVIFLYFVTFPRKKD
jgi:hypothetical protein